MNCSCRTPDVVRKEATSRWSTLPRKPADPGTRKRDLIENPFNQLTSLVAAAGTTTFTYDGRGNQITKAEPSATTTYSYDGRNRLTDISLPGGITNHFGYDSQGLRVYMNDSSGARDILLDGIEELAEYDVTGTVRIARYDHDPSRVDGLLAQVTQGKAQFLIDAIGSVYGLTVANGMLSDSAQYDVFGARAVDPSTHWGFTGRRNDAFGALYGRSRYYDSVIGRWAEPDPLFYSTARAALSVVEDGQSLVQQSTNLYPYAAARPVNGADPSGMLFFIPDAPTLVSLAESSMLAPLTEYFATRVGPLLGWEKCPDCVVAAVSAEVVAAELLGRRIPLAIFGLELNGLYRPGDAGHRIQIAEKEAALARHASVMLAKCLQFPLKALGLWYLGIAAVDWYAAAGPVRLN